VAVEVAHGTGGRGSSHRTPVTGPRRVSSGQESGWGGIVRAPVVVVGASVVVGRKVVAKTNREKAL
jgi:hypothetical protein